MLLPLTGVHAIEHPLQIFQCRPVLTGAYLSLGFMFLAVH